jgi:hypothetical protein
VVVLGATIAEAYTTSLMTTPALSATPLFLTANIARRKGFVNPSALPALPPTTLPMVAAVFFAQVWLRIVPTVPKLEDMA